MSTVTSDPRVERSRKAVLDATLALLVERGPGVSVEAVAERSGVAKTTIYRHWPTRAALLAAAWDALPRETVSPLPGDLDTDLQLLARSLVHRLTTPPLSVLLPDLVAASARDDDMRAVHDRLLARPRPILQRIRAAIDKGELPARTDADLVTSLVVGPLMYRRLVLHRPVRAADADALVAAALVVARSAA